MTSSPRRAWIALVSAPFLLGLAVAPIVVYLAANGFDTSEMFEAAAPLAPIPVAVGMGLVFLLTRSLARRDDLRLRDLGWRRPSGEEIAVGIVAGSAITMLNLLAVYPAFESVAPRFDPVLSAVPLPLALAGFTIAVVAEDTLYRGFALVQLRRRHNTVAAIAITSAFYAMLSPPFSPLVTAWAFGMGVLLCAIRVWRDNLWTVAIAHWVVVLSPKLLT